jgi:hypothetical protein
MITPALDWNSARIFPAFLMAAGQSPYFPAMAGPATGWIYGPIMPILHMPASMAPTITSAMVVSACINITAFVLPILVLADYAAKQCGLVHERIAISVTCLGLLLAAPGLSDYLLWIQSDQVAISLSLLSCLFLVRHEASRSRTDLCLAATLAVLSVWTKQIAIAVPLAHMAYIVVIRRDLKWAYRYLGWFSIAGIVVGTLMIRFFGLDPLVYNLWIVPSGNHFKGRASVWLANPLGLLKEAGPSLIVAAILWRVADRRKPSRFDQHPSLKAVITLLLTMAVCQLPFNLLGAAKIGGGGNSFHMVVTVYVMAILCAVAAAGAWQNVIKRVHFTWMSAGAALLGAALTLIAYPVRLTPDPHLEAARILADGHHGQVYFPRNPLVTWWTEKKAYHLEYGLIDQAVAGFPVSKERYWAYLPSDLRLLVYPSRLDQGLATQLIKLGGRLEGADYVIHYVAKPRKE